MNGDRDVPVAAIDCGTNATRLLIARRLGKDVIRETRITRLGQGVDRDGLLAVEAMQRTLDALRDYRRKIDKLGVVRGRMVATSAVRDAANGADFLAAAADVVGFAAELLSGEEEGQLAYAGATAALAPIEGDDVVVDIGGGSTELIIRRDGFLSAVSLDMGSVRLTERHLAGDPPTKLEIEAATTTVRRNLDAAVAAAPGLVALAPGRRLVGLAGTVTTLAVLALGIRGYDRVRVHHAVLPFEAITQWCASLLAEPAKARGARPGVPRGREDVIAGGALILREVMDRFELPNCLVSETDVLDGLVLSVISDLRR